MNISDCRTSPHILKHKQTSQFILLENLKNIYFFSCVEFVFSCLIVSTFQPPSSGTSSGLDSEEQFPQAEFILKRKIEEKEERKCLHRLSHRGMECRSYMRLCSHRVRRSILIDWEWAVGRRRVTTSKKSLSRIKSEWCSCRGRQMEFPV